MAEARLAARELLAELRERHLCGLRCRGAGLLGVPVDVDLAELRGQLLVDLSIRVHLRLVEAALLDRLLQAAFDLVARDVAPRQGCEGVRDVSLPAVEAPGLPAALRGPCGLGVLVPRGGGLLVFAFVEAQRVGAGCAARQVVAVGAADAAEPGPLESPLEPLAAELERGRVRELPVVHRELEERPVCLGQLAVGGEAGPEPPFLPVAAVLLRERLGRGGAVPGERLEQAFLVERLAVLPDRDELGAPGYGELGVPSAAEPVQALVGRGHPYPGRHGGRRGVVVPMRVVAVRAGRPVAVRTGVPVLVAGVLGRLRGVLLLAGGVLAEVAYDLADPHVPELGAPVEVLLGRPQVVLRVGVLGVLRPVVGLPG